MRIEDGQGANAHAGSDHRTKQQNHRWADVAV
jgi:hypothetical protein